MDYFLPLLPLLLAGLLAAGENAVVNLNDQKLKRAAETNPRARLVLSIATQPSRLRIASNTLRVLLYSLSAMLLVYYFRQAALDLAGSALGALPTALAGLLLFTVAALLFALLVNLFCYEIPSRLAGHYPEKIAYALAPLVQGYTWLLAPLAAAIRAVSKAIVGVFGVDYTHEIATATEEEIRMLVDAGEEEGSIEQSKKDMINNIFDFDDRTAGEVMTHRTDLCAIDIEMNLAEIVTLITQAGNSRIPVYEDSTDDIIGILYVKDLLPLVVQDNKDFNLRDALRKPLFVPEATPCRALFTQFKEKKMHIAVVSDEYGGTAGIVTMEDLMESIVGNIQDEYDDEQEASAQISENIFTLDGSIPMDTVAQLLDIQLPEDTQYDTIGGLIVERLDFIPDASQHPEIEISGVKFTVLEADERRIIKVRAEKLVRLND